MNLAPIVLFVYNRPWHTKQTLDALQKNNLAKESELFIYSDGPKNNDAEKSVEEVRKLINKVTDFKKVTIVKREENWGLAASIIDGVTTLVNQYGKIIVLEDDLVTSPCFLNYMNDALEFYKDKKNVWQISGYTPPMENKNSEDYFFLKITSCWGWATWSDRWGFFYKDTEKLLSQFDDNMIIDFNVNNTYDYFDHILLNNSGELDTWAVFWYAVSYLNNGISLFSRKSFVNNIGHDGSGVHCEKSDVFSTELVEEYKATFSFDCSVSDSMTKSLAEYYKSQKRTLLSRIVNKLRTIFK